SISLQSCMCRVREHQPNRMYNKGPTRTYCGVASMIRHGIMSSLALLLPVFASLGNAAEADLTAGNYEKWRGFIYVKPSAVRWLDIPWRTTFWAGVVDSQKEDKPLLLWIYAGHPFGPC